AVSVAIDCRTQFDIAAHFGNQIGAPSAGHNPCTDAGVSIRAVPLQEAKDGGLTDGTASLALDFLNAFLVHEPGGSADECLINLNLTVHLVKGLRLHGEPDAMEHEPGGFLSN